MLFWFVSKQFCLFRLFRYRFETPKQTEIFSFWFHETNPKQILFRFVSVRTKIFLFCFEDTLGQCIRIRNQDPDPGGQKWPQKTEKVRNFLSWSAECSLWGLKAYPVSWRSIKLFLIKVAFIHQKQNLCSWFFKVFAKTRILLMIWPCNTEYLGYHAFYLPCRALRNAYVVLSRNSISASAAEIK